MNKTAQTKSLVKNQTMSQQEPDLETAETELNGRRKSLSQIEEVAARV